MIPLSIDVQAEIRKITQSQHLNAVHLAVQGVRHAIRHHPRRIHIHNRGAKISIHQDGHPLATDEWRAIRDVLWHPDLNTRQQALTRLEQRFGVTLLTVLAEKPRVQLRSGSWRVKVVRGRLVEERGQPAHGYQITWSRPRRHRALESAELKFFCEFCDVPVFLNGRQINHPMEVDECILQVDWNQEHGRGVFGIPLASDLHHLIFLKQGIRFGTQPMDSTSGKVAHGIWNSGLTEFEPHFKRSIDMGRQAGKTAVQELYRALPSHFDAMEDTQRQRAKTLILRDHDPDWVRTYGRLPLFHSAGRPFSITCRDLQQLHQRLGMVSYTREARRDLDHLPRLDQADLDFLRNRFGMHFQAVPSTRQRRRWKWKALRFWKKGPQSRSPTDPSVEKSVLHAMNQDVGWNISLVRGIPGHAGYDHRGIRHVQVPEDHPVWIATLQTIRRAPITLQAARFALFQHFRAGSPPCSRPTHSVAWSNHPSHNVSPPSQ